MLPSSVRALVLTASCALGSVGCASALESVVVDASEVDQYPSGLRVVYDDRAPMLGGVRLEIEPDGVVRRWSDAPSAVVASGAPEELLDDVERLPPTPAREADSTGRADADAMAQLASILAAVEPWDRPADEEADVRIDRRRALLRIELSGDTAETWQWVEPSESGRDRVTSVRAWAESRVAWPQPSAPVIEEEPEDEGPPTVLRSP